MESLTLPGASSPKQMVFTAAENQSATPENPSAPMKNLKHKKGLISLPSAASK